MATTWTATSNDFCRPHRGPVRLRTFPEGPSQTFKKGHPVILSGTSGHENELLIITEDKTTGVVGVSCEDASGTTGTLIAVWMAEPGVEFKARVQDAATILYSNIGVKYGGHLDGTNKIFRVDTSETTALEVVVTDLVDPVNDINGFVAFQFVSTARGIFQG